MRVRGMELRRSEERVMTALMEGHTTFKALGKELGVSTRTAKAQVNALANSLGVDQKRYNVKVRLVYLLALESKMLAGGWPD